MLDRFWKSPQADTAPQILSADSERLSQRVANSVADWLPVPWTILPVQFSRSIFELRPALISLVGEYLDDSLFFYRASPSEIAFISQFFSGNALYEHFRFFTEDGKHYGYYRFSHPNDQSYDLSGYLEALLGCERWWIYVSTHLLLRPRSGNFVFLDDPEVDFFLTVRHELDHLVRHLLSILRNYRNSTQFASNHLGRLERKKSELHAFYHQANLSIKLKGQGVDISWDEILDHHTGWSHTLGEVSDDYRWVVEHVRSIIASRNAFYNALRAKYGSNATSRNEYSSISPEWYRIFDMFCRALSIGFEAIRNEGELEVFLEYVWSLWRGIPAAPVWADEFLRRIWNPTNRARTTSAYSEFIAAFAG